MDDLRAERLLSRATFGPRPGDAQALRNQGAEAWLAAALAAPTAGSGAVATARRGAPPSDDAPDPLAALGALDRDDPASRRMFRDETRRAALAAAGARVVAAVHGDDARGVGARVGPLGLGEVMVDFWANHFSVFARKGPLALFLAEYERDVLRRFALGRFEDLLLAVARSPAMLISLDNVRSRSERRGGENENYARELLELHTLGVDGGYTQEDVVQTARVFTGWSLESRTNPVFEFRPRIHEPGPKRVLGVAIPEAGVEEGESLLRRLARHPATARHLSTKLARRFVSDDPPPALVDRVSRRYLDSGGDLRATLHELLLSPEFVDPAQRKVKTPLELFASSVRATGGDTNGGAPALFALFRLGELPFHCRTPAGYPDVAAHWIDPGGMIGRFGLAFALANGRLEDTRLGDAPLAGAEGGGTAGRALALASPEFQWQ